STEQNKTREPVRIEPQALSLRRPIRSDRFVKLGPQDHSGGGINTLIGITQRLCLLNSLLRTADEVLILILFHPKMGRVIREVGQDGNEGNLRKGGIETFIQRPVEVGYQRYDQVRSGAGPVLCK